VATLILTATVYDVDPQTWLADALAYIDAAALAKPKTNSDPQRMVTIDGTSWVVS
jgi:hypothetical protein